MTESYPQMSIFKTTWQLETVDCPTGRKFCKKSTKSLSLTTFSNLKYVEVFYICPSELPITGEKGSNKRFTCDKAAN